MDDHADDLGILEVALNGGVGLPAFRDLDVLSLQRSTFDETYLRFLDEQIGLNARGDEWSARLSERRRALTGWHDHPLVVARAKLGETEWWFKIDLASRQLVHSECYTADQRRAKGS